MSKTVSGSTSQFLWDVAAALPVFLKDGSTNYISGPGGLPLEQVNGSSVLWLHHDQLGSTRLVTNSSGATQATYTFDPYGNLTAITGTITNPMRLAGEYNDSESGVYYLRARYYDPATGQFLSRDPAVATTRQPYSYISDNPLSGVDPLGLCDLNPFGHDSCASVIATGLSQLPGAILNDAKQGQENFIKNVQDPKLRPLVAVGVVALAGAAIIATAGLAASASGAGLAGQAGLSKVGPAIFLGAVCLRWYRWVSAL